MHDYTEVYKPGRLHWDGVFSHEHGVPGYPNLAGFSQWARVYRLCRGYNKRSSSSYIKWPFFIWHICGLRGSRNDTKVAIMYSKLGQFVNP